MLRDNHGDVAGAESDASSAERSISEHGNHPWSARVCRQRGTPGWAHRQPSGQGAEPPVLQAGLGRRCDAGDRYIWIVYFESAEEAGHNSERSETGGYSQRLQTMCSEGPTFVDLEIFARWPDSALPLGSARVTDLSAQSHRCTQNASVAGRWSERHMGHPLSPRTPLYP